MQNISKIMTVCHINFIKETNKVLIIYFRKLEFVESASTKKSCG